MERTTHVVAVCGSHAEESVTRVALNETLTAAAAADAQTTLADLRECDFPTFDADKQDAEDATELRRQLQTADAIVPGTPMYHDTFSSPLKTALDYSGFDELEDTTVGLLGVSGGAFPRAALDHFRTTMRALDAWTLTLDVAIPNSYEQVVDGELVDDSLRDRTHGLGTVLVRNAGIAQYSEQTAAPMTKAD